MSCLFGHRWSTWEEDYGYLVNNYNTLKSHYHTAYSRLDKAGLLRDHEHASAKPPLRSVPSGDDQ